MSMISRQKLIEEVKKALNRDSIGLNDKWNLAIARVIKIIKDQPPADQWIPCKTELPIERTKVLVCMKDGFCDTAWFDGYGFRMREFCTNAENVTAWMPLPEAYKGE